MNNKAIHFLKNFSYTIMSNLLSLAVSTLVVLIVPKLIGVEEYGYWQLYLFYISYVGFLHFGWTDGIYLRYGGEKYKNLDKRLFYSQFFMITIMQILIALIIILISFGVFEDENKLFIIFMTTLCMIISNIRSILLFILQATNRIQEYAKITMVGQIFYFCIMVSFLLINFRDFKLLIGADIIGRLISLSYAVYCCKDIVFRPINDFYFSFKEARENVVVGIKLMFAYIASLLIIGVVRFGIEQSWDVVTFGKVSLTLSISKLIMLFINAVGIILFPILRKSNKDRLPYIYGTMRDMLMVILLGVLLVYYPFKIVLSIWLPDYADSLMYIALLFPMVIFEGKTALLINTYLKAMRKEKFMLKINVVSLALSIIITYLTTMVLKNLDLAVLSITFLLAFRSIFAEIYLSKVIDINIFKDIFLELIIVSFFIVSGWFIDTGIVVLLYSLVYILYLIIKRKDIKRTINNIKLLARA